MNHDETRRMIAAMLRRSLAHAGLTCALDGLPGRS